MSVNPSAVDLQVPKLWSGDPAKPHISTTRLVVDAFKEQPPHEVEATLFGLYGGERVTATGYLHIGSNNLELLSPENAAATGVKVDKRNKQAAIRTTG